MRTCVWEHCSHCFCKQCSHCLQKTNAFFCEMCVRHCFLLWNLDMKSLYTEIHLKDCSYLYSTMTLLSKYLWNITNLFVILLNNKLIFNAFYRNRLLSSNQKCHVILSTSGDTAVSLAKYKNNLYCLSTNK